MLNYQRPYVVESIEGDFAVNDTAVSKTINGAGVLIQNTGSEPLYFNVDDTTATAANGFKVPANTIFPILITCRTLSLISTSTGTTVQLLKVKSI